MSRHISRCIDIIQHPHVSLNTPPFFVLMPTFYVCRYTPGRWQSKTPILLRNVDKKSTETVFSIAICGPTGDKWQSKILFLSIFNQHLWIVDNVFYCLLSGVIHSIEFFMETNKLNPDQTEPLEAVCSVSILFAI